MPPPYFLLINSVFSTTGINVQTNESIGNGKHCLIRERTLYDVTHLFRFYSSCVDVTEGKVSDGDVVKNNVEVISTLGEFLPHQQTDSLTLRD